MTIPEKIMEHAIEVCQQGIAAGNSPFGAAIATPDGELIHAAHNVVRQTCDITAHAEINCLRGACEKLGKIDLSGLIMATTCEPCPMCAAAIHWANLETVYYGATIEDADTAGFNELHLSCQSLYEQGKSNVKVVTDILRPQCADLFRQWQQGPHPNPY